MGRPRLTLIPGGRASAPPPRPAGSRRAPDPAPRDSRIPAWLRAGGPGSPRPGRGAGLWGWVFAITGMVGVGLVLLWGQPLLGLGLVCLAVSGIVAPPGAAPDPRSRPGRAALALSAAGILLVLADLAVSFV